MKTPPLIPGWLLLATGAAILAAMCVSVSGCASMNAASMADLQAHEERHCEGWSHTGKAPFYTWAKTRPEASKPWFYVRVIDTDSACRSMGADLRRELGHIAACAIWQPNSCIIILPETK